MVEVDFMSEDKKLVKVKESFFKRLLDKIRNFFTKNDKDEIQVTDINNINSVNNYDKEGKNKKNEFLNNIKIQEDMGIIALKIQLENNEIKAIDLTDEQIEKLQKIYDEEILEKKNKINRLKRNM